jgi:hypothetical protein
METARLRPPGRARTRHIVLALDRERLGFTWPSLRRTEAFRRPARAGSAGRFTTSAASEFEPATGRTRNPRRTTRRSCALNRS